MLMYNWQAETKPEFSTSLKELIFGYPEYLIYTFLFRPCVFIVLDTGNRIHLWDLGAGDIYPVHGVEFDDKVIQEFLKTNLSEIA
jgi:hypothetical protein